MISPPIPRGIGVFFCPKMLESPVMNKNLPEYACIHSEFKVF